MKRLTLVLLLLGITLSLSWAQQADLADLAPKKEENALLWRITGNGLDSTSYLFGTIHMIGKEDFILTDKARSSFTTANRIAFEIDLEDMNDMSKMMPLMMKAFMNGDTTLQDLLTEEEYGVVKNHFESMGLPMMFLERVKPMFLSAMSSEDALSMQTDPGSVVSYEMEFMKMAQEQDKDIAGLETAEYQMSMFDSIPYGVQAQMLVESISAGKSEGEDQFQKLVELYKQEDIYGLQEMMQTEEAGIAQYEDLLLNNRNRNWIPKMKSMMAEGPTFFAVGAGHLPGEHGVIALLRAEGYTVKPVQ